jgi:hypothetical protein
MQLPSRTFLDFKELQTFIFISFYQCLPATYANSPALSTKILQIIKKDFAFRNNFPIISTDYNKET